MRVMNEQSIRCVGCVGSCIIDECDAENCDSVMR